MNVDVDKAPLVVAVSAKIDNADPPAAASVV